VGEINGPPEEFQRIHSRFVTAFSKTELLLNPLEEDHGELIKVIDSNYRAITAPWQRFLGRLWQRLLRLLGRTASESGRLRHGDGGQGRGDRRRRVLKLPTVPFAKTSP
jgi:hypothetical protein